MIDVEEILKMNPNQKINYDRVMQKIVQDWERIEKQPDHSYAYLLCLIDLYPRISQSICGCNNLTA